MHPFDLAIIVAYLITIIAVGFKLSTRVHDARDYFLAGRSLTWWVIGLSIIGTNIGANDYVGASGGAYRVGIAQANFEWIGAIPAMILASLVFIPLYWRAGVYSIPEYLGPALQPGRPRAGSSHRQRVRAVRHRRGAVGDRTHPAVLPRLADLGRHTGDRYRRRSLQHLRRSGRCRLHRRNSGHHHVSRWRRHRCARHQRSRRHERLRQNPDLRESNPPAGLSARPIIRISPGPVFCSVWPSCCLPPTGVADRRFCSARWAREPNGMPALR